MNILHKAIIVLALLFLLGGCLVVLMGCCASQRPSPVEPVIPPTPTQILYKVVYQTNWLVVVSIIGIAISVAAFVNGSKAALPIGMGSLAALGMTLATIRYAQWIALCSFLAALLIFFATVIKKNVALKQLIVGIQKMKGFVTNDLVNKTVTAEQNKDTIKLVLGTKAGLKLKGKIQ